MPTLTHEAFLALPPGTLIRDRYRDTAVLGADGMWHFHETAGLPPEYVFRHYAPLETYKTRIGDRITLAAELDRLPRGAEVGDEIEVRLLRGEGSTWTEPRTGRALTAAEVLSEHRDVRLVRKSMPPTWRHLTAKQEARVRAWLDEGAAATLRYPVLVPKGQEEALLRAVTIAWGYAVTPRPSGAFNAGRVRSSMGRILADARVNVAALASLNEVRVPAWDGSVKMDDSRQTLGEFLSEALAEPWAAFLDDLAVRAIRTQS